MDYVFIANGRAHPNWVEKSKIKKLQENIPKCVFHDIENAYVRNRVHSLLIPPFSLSHTAPQAEILELPGALLNTSYFHFAPHLQCNSSKTSWWISFFDVSFWR